MANPEETELGAARARIGGDLFRRRTDRTSRLGLPERDMAADALRQSRWADARGAPAAKRPLHQPILARMITDHRQRPAIHQCVAEDRQCPRQTREFVVDGDADRLKEPGEVTRPAAAAEDGPDGVDQVIA